MRFKLFTISLLFLSIGSHAEGVNHDAMYKEAQAIFDKSAHLLAAQDKPVPSNNNIVDNALMNESIMEMKKSSEQVLEKYFKEQGASAGNDKSNLFVLVSFSMPDSLIKQYIDEADKYGAKVALIGLVDNDFALTKARIGDIVRDSNKGGMIIDPNLFTTYKVESVPAILLTADNYPCQSTECIADQFDIMYGAVHIQYALESFQTEGNLKDVAADKLKARQG